MTLTYTAKSDLTVLTAMGLVGFSPYTPQPMSTAAPRRCREARRVMVEPRRDRLHGSRCLAGVLPATIRPERAFRRFWSKALTAVGKFATIFQVTKNTRPVRWIKAARKDFEDFPQRARDDLLDALTAVADGGHPIIAKPLAGLGSGVMELALRHRGDAFRVVYALLIGADL
jgi:hypothetical protein